jgi:hypothetical protein
MQAGREASRSDKHANMLFGRLVSLNMIERLTDSIGKVFLSFFFRFRC